MKYEYVFIAAILIVIAIILFKRGKKIEQPDANKLNNAKIKGLNMANGGMKAHELTVAKTNNEGIISSQEKKERKILKPVGWVVSNNEEKIIDEKAHEDTNYDILIVDDSQTVLHYLKNILSESKFNTILRKDGQEALQYLVDTKNSVPNLILTDLEMPNMNGVELINNLKTINRVRNIPIIIVASNPENQIYMLEDKIVNGIVKKPFNKTEILQQVNYLINP